MAKMIQVRNVPERLHRELIRRAKLRRQTLTDYIEDVLEREVAHPPIEELLERIERLPPLELPQPTTDVIRAARRERERHLAKVQRDLQTRRSGP